MPEENVTEVVENKDPNARAEVVADTETPEPKESEKGLSLRDALEVAIISEKDTREQEKPKRDKDLEVSYKGKRQKEASSQEQLKPLEPPAEYTNEEKEDFLAATPVQQRAALRLMKQSHAALQKLSAGHEELKRGRAEYSHLETLAKDLEPFARAIGNKEPITVAMQKALRMWSEFANPDDPTAAAAEYLRARGRGDAIPESWVNNNKQSRNTQEDNALQKQVNALTLRLAQEDQKRALQPVIEALSEFESTKNAAGKPKYPSFRSEDSSEEGIRFAKLFGSLVNGTTGFSQEFIARTKERIPNLTKARLYEEAYKFSGGKVDESEAPRNQSMQDKIIRSSRAAAPVPGNVTRSSSSSGKKTYATTREAAAAALAEIREAEGN